MSRSRPALAAHASLSAFALAAFSLLGTVAASAATTPASATASTPAAIPQPPAWTREDLAAAKALRDRLVKGSEAFPFVRDLTTEVGPRSAGSAGDAAAVVWAKAAAGGPGLRPASTRRKSRFPIGTAANWRCARSRPSRSGW